MPLWALLGFILSLSQIRFLKNNRLNTIHILVKIRFCHANKEDIFYDEGGETLAHVVQRRGRCRLPGNIQGQVWWGSEEPDPVEDVPAHSRGVGLDDL